MHAIRATARHNSRTIDDKGGRAFRLNKRSEPFHGVGQPALIGVGEGQRDGSHLAGQDAGAEPAGEGRDIADRGSEEHQAGGFIVHAAVQL